MNTKSEIKWREMLMKVTPELVEKNFPKGQCKERGAAIVLHAEMLLAMTQALADCEASVVDIKAWIRCEDAFYEYQEGKMSKGKLCDIIVTALKKKFFILNTPVAELEQPLATNQ